jgi:metacaspase-1
MAKGLSIHIGLNHVDPAHYEGWDGELNACIADAQDMQALAKKRGFKGRQPVA